MKKIAIIQSNYIPWKGYFHIIQKADHFVFLDTAQYTCRDWRNRNQIKTPQGPKWLTVPTNGSQSIAINQVRIDNTSKWQNNHFAALKQNYNRCDFFSDFLPVLQEIYLDQKWNSLSELNQFSIKKIAKLLEISTEFHNSKEFILPFGKNEKIISITKQLGGTHYISGPSAKNYIDEKLFEVNGIELEFMSYENYPEYQQPWGNFQHNVTIFDLLFCAGCRTTKYIWNK